MEEEAQNRRLFTAITLCLFALGVYTLFWAPKKEPPATPASMAVATSTTTDGTAATLAQTSSSAVGIQGEVPPAPRPDPEFFEFSGSVEVDKEAIPYQVTLTNVGGGIESFVLPEYFERTKENTVSEAPIRLADPTSSETDDEKAQYAQAGSIRFTEGTSFTVPERIVFDVVEEDTNKVTYRYSTRDGVEIERVYEFDASKFEIRMRVAVRNKSRRKQTYQLEVGTALALNEATEPSGGFLFLPASAPDHLQTQCFTSEDVERANYGSVLTESEKFTEGVKWVAIDRQYFLGAIIARLESAAECELMAKDKVARAVMRMEPVELAPGDEKLHMFDAYFGVKKPSLLSQEEAGLEGSIDYTLIGALNLAPLCAALLWVMGIMHSITGSWGIAIIALTMLVKLVLFPLNQRSMKSMRAMSALKPQMEKIREKFKDDPQRQNEEMMRLYRENNVNPVGGCLPLLLQMPIFIALYRALSASVDLYQQEFLWIGDLTTRDPYWILPIALVVVMFLQQRSTPSSMDPAQQRIMLYTMPLVFGFIMSNAPAGLSLYFLANTVLTIVQQHLINRSIGPAEGSPPALEAKA